MCFKVWESITIPTFAKQARYGVKAGQPNPRFLDAKLFNDLVLTPYRDAKFERHTGPFLFEFQRHGQSIDEFCFRLDTFFCQLPKDFPPKSTVHDYLELWNWDGTVERIHHALYLAVREQEGREASPTAAIIDSQTAKGSQKGGLGLILRATTRARRSRVASGTSWSTRWVSC